MTLNNNENYFGSSVVNAGDATNPSDPTYVLVKPETTTSGDFEAFASMGKETNGDIEESTFGIMPFIKKLSHWYFSPPSRNLWTL